MRTALVTGGSGFFGGILKRSLLERGWSVINIDLVKDEDGHPNLISIQGDIRNPDVLESAFMNHESGIMNHEPVSAIFHCAAILAHAVKDKTFLWSSNVDGTRSIAEFAKRHRIKKIVFISSNCLWGEGFGRPITEEDPPNPVEIYGKSKWEGEKILREYQNDLDVVIIRSTTIVDAGRLGLLAILFEFIDEGRKVWTVGGGGNRYQFIFAGDLTDACIKAADFPGSETFNIGSDDVKSFREVYQSVINRAGSRSRIAALPKTLTLFGMKVLYWLGLSPLGPYQYKMIAEDFSFDTSRIKTKLHWKPTLTNQEMLWRAYEFYRDHRKDLKAGDTVSAHRQPAKMGIIRVLKWMS